MIRTSILALLLLISPHSLGNDPSTPISRVNRILQAELGLSIATFSFLVREAGSTKTEYIDSWRFDALPWEVRELEVENYLRIVVFKGVYRGRTAYLTTYRATEKALPILEQASEVEWDLTKEVQPPSVFEEVLLVYDSGAK